MQDALSKPTYDSLNSAPTARELRTRIKESQSNEAHLRFFQELGADLFTNGFHDNISQACLNQLSELLAADHGLMAIEGVGVLTVTASKGHALPVGARIPMLGNIASLLKAPVQFSVLQTPGARVWTQAPTSDMQEWLIPIALQQKSVGLIALCGQHLKATPEDNAVLLSICGLLGLALQPKTQKATPLADSAILETLTPREREIFALLPSGMSNIELASKLGIAPGTVKIHIERVFSKLNVRDRTQAAIKALEMGYKSGV